MSCQPTGNNRFPGREDADMGIGTMIVFIAMILVASVAAGLLINSAYLIQQQGEETGRLAINNVATSFIIHNMLGDRYDETTGEFQDTIQIMELKISLAAGSPALAMENVIIEATTANGEANLIFDTSATARGYMHEWDDYDPDDTDSLRAQSAEGTYTVMELRDPDDTFYTTSIDTDNPDFVVSQGCLLRVFLNLGVNGITFGTQDWLALKIIPKHGIPVYDMVVAPETFSDRFVTF